MRQRISRTWWIELAVYLALGVLAATALCLAASALLLGLPHGWHAGTTWVHIEHRFIWLTSRLVPASVAAYLLVRLRRRVMEHLTRNSALTSPRYRGQHR
ncbi:hypothetical protein OG302_02685 [Streptomyces sp. NBC_01283]|uniref:hypothetical protein n=1 Tax=Streptomyces sp. NBC_01283 TaxID=2903812 RepID=UPI00352F3547|nr:hypothetical protein OG302_02685 [Streptomyces sp. NBC_01283]